MAYPTILFNTGTGSDSLASGAGPSTALNGGLANTTAASNVVQLGDEYSNSINEDLSVAIDGINVTFIVAHTPNPSISTFASLSLNAIPLIYGVDYTAVGDTITMTVAPQIGDTLLITYRYNGPDLSLITTDGSAVVWVQSASGKQFGVITAVDPVTATLTIDGNFVNSETHILWAVGGKRNNFDSSSSRKVFTDARPGWEIRTETDQTLNSTLILSAAGSLTDGRIILGSTSTRRKVDISIDDNVVIQSANYWLFDNIEFNTRGSWTGLSSAYHIMIRKCLFTGTGTGFASTNGISLIIDSAFAVIGPGIACNTTASALFVANCWFKCSSMAVTPAPTGINVFINNLFISNTNSYQQIYYVPTDYAPIIVINCVFYANGKTSTYGMDIENNTMGLLVANNIFKDHSLGLNTTVNADISFLFNDYNNYYNNGTDRLNISAGSHDLALDPQFVNDSGGDFSIGTNLKAKGWPDAAINVGAEQSSTKFFIDVGAAQREESGGGSTTIVESGCRGGFIN